MMPSISPHDQFDRIFHPKTLAIIGVSSNGWGFGRGILQSNLAMGYSGRIYPVNPRGGEVDGLMIYRSIEDIPDDIDLAIIAVAAPHVPAALEACRKKGAAGAQIITAGFRESGTSEGAALEDEIRSIAAAGIRVIGPNCFGIYCPRCGLTFPPGLDLSRDTGPVAFLSQSGGMSIDFAHLGAGMGIRFSKMISFGNGADLRETELLAYLGSDVETGIISMYMEGVDNGPAFFETLKDVTKRKPAIIYKGGLSEAGQNAVASHTASMGGSRTIWSSILRQAGAIQVQDLREMAQASLAFALLPPGAYKGVTVVGGGGALGVAACDAAEAWGLEIPPLKPDTVEKIMAVLPKPGSSANNPIDAASPYTSPAVLREALYQAALDDRVHVQILIQLIYHLNVLAKGLGLSSIRDVSPHLELVRIVKEVAEQTGKPIVMVLPNLKGLPESIGIEELIREARHAFLAQGIPVYEDLGDALRAIHHVSAYYVHRRTIL